MGGGSIDGAPSVTRSVASTEIAAVNQLADVLVVLHNLRAHIGLDAHSPHRPMGLLPLYPLQRIGRLFSGKTDRGSGRLARLRDHDG